VQLALAALVHHLLRQCQFLRQRLPQGPNRRARQPRPLGSSGQWRRPVVAHAQCSISRSALLHHQQDCTKADLDLLACPVQPVYDACHGQCAAVGGQGPPCIPLLPSPGASQSRCSSARQVGRLPEHPKICCRQALSPNKPRRHERPAMALTPDRSMALRMGYRVCQVILNREPTSQAVCRL
jgi:hypothetical protein